MGFEGDVWNDIVFRLLRGILSAIAKKFPTSFPPHQRGRQYERPIVAAGLQWWCTIGQERCGRIAGA